MSSPADKGDAQVVIMSEMTDSQGHHNAPLPQPVFAAVALVSCGIYPQAFELRALAAREWRGVRHAADGDAMVGQLHVFGCQKLPTATWCSSVLSAERTERQTTTPTLQHVKGGKAIAPALSAPPPNPHKEKH